MQVSPMPDNAEVRKAVQTHAMLVSRRPIVERRAWINHRKCAIAPIRACTYNRPMRSCGEIVDVVCPIRVLNFN